MKIKFPFAAARYATVAGACLFFFLSTAGNAQDASVMVKFGVVDVELIEREASMNKDIGSQINELRRKLSDEVKNEEAVLRKSSEDLQRQKVLLAPDAFDQEVRKFRQRELEFQKKIQDRNNDFNRVRVFARNAFVTELNKALTEITKEHQFTLILRRSQVLVAAEFLDITAPILGRLNKNMPKFTIPKNVTQPTATKAAPAPKAAKSTPAPKK